jgi:hypothetical protein
VAGKRIAIISIVVLISGIVLLGYFLNRSRKSLFTDPYKVVSPDACIVIETFDLRNLINSVTTGKGIFSEIENVKEFSSFSTKLKYLADLVNNAGFKRILQEGTAVISFHPSEKGKLIPFFSKTIPAEIGNRQLRDALQTSGIKEICELTVNGRRLFGLPYIVNDRKDTVFVAISSGLIISSTSGNLVKKVLQSTPETDIRNVPGFSRILLSTGKDEDKLFLVFGNLKKVVTGILAQGESSLADKITKIGKCAGGDIFIDDDGISLSGYSESNDSSEFLFRHKPVEPIEFQTYRILPSATALFKSRVLTHDPAEIRAVTQVPDKIKRMAEELEPFIGDEITRAFIDIKDNPADRNSLVIYKLKNRVQCENIFLKYLGDESTIAYFRPDEQTKLPVYITASTGLVSVMMPDFAPGFTDSCIAFYDNYLITGNSYVTISRFLYDNMLNKTLANDILYREFEKMIPTRAGFLFYCVPSKSIDYLADFLTREVADELRANKSSLDKIQSVGFQLASINNMIYNNISVSYKDVIREESTTEWETLLDTTAGIKPFFFTNHNTGAKEIFIQDIKNNAYLINTAGRVLWKVPLKEKINGTIYMIDYYRNGKYQLMFSGKNNLHLLDRNGNYVERYPVRLRSPATSPLSLFDYDNNKNYRLVVAGEDKLVYIYDRSGSVVRGWEPFRTAGYVTAEAGFYRVSGKDYIVVADESSIYFLDRSGKVRLRLKDAVTKARGSSLRLAPGSDPILVCSAPDGTVQQINFNGTVKKFSFRKFSFDHSFDFFDVDGDGFGEYVFIDSGMVYLYDHNMKEMFSKDFNTDKLGGPINFTFSSTNREIGVFDINKNLIYLINSKGEIMDGFPLRGASMFSIGKLSSGPGWNLIVGGTDRFLYNYKVGIWLK